MREIKFRAWDENQQAVRRQRNGVLAWASLWTIRQFQFLGCAPVTTYRECRRFMSDYSVGDELLLQETVYSGEQMKKGKPLEFTWRTIKGEVNYILHGGYGLVDGWVILDVTHVERNYE